MRDCDVAQAAEFVRALKQQLHEMTARLARLERQAVTDALRLEAAALLLDIQEAQVLIDRLQRRYLSGDEHARQHSAAAVQGVVTPRRGIREGVSYGKLGRGVTCTDMRGYMHEEC